MPRYSELQPAQTLDGTEKIAVLQNRNTRMASVQDWADLVYQHHQFNFPASLVVNDSNITGAFVDDALNNLGSSLIAAVSGLNSTIDAEVADLNTRIDSEVSILNIRINDEVADLNSRIDAEVLALETAFAADQASQSAALSAALTAHTSLTNNPHSVTKAQVGLGNADNTSDVDKPVSTAQQSAIDAAITAIKGGVAAAGDTLAELYALITTHTGLTNNPHSVTKSQVGLANADNTSDANKPISTATQTALDLKAPLASPSLTGTPLTPTAAPGTNTTQIASTAFVKAAVDVVLGGVAAAGDTLSELYTLITTHIANVSNPHSVTKTQVGLGSADNTADTAKPVSTAQAAAILVVKTTSPLNTGTADKTIAAGDLGTTVELTGATGRTYTIPTGLGASVFFNWIQTGTGQMTFAAGAGASLNGKNGLKSSGQYAMGTCWTKDGTAWFIGGDTGP